MFHWKNYCFLIICVLLHFRTRILIKNSTCLAKHGYWQHFVRVFDLKVYKTFILDTLARTNATMPVGLCEITATICKDSDRFVSPSMSPIVTPFVNIFVSLFVNPFCESFQ